MPRDKKGRQKFSILKKTTGLCPSRSYYYMTYRTEGNGWLCVWIIKKDNVQLMLSSFWHSVIMKNRKVDSRVEWFSTFYQTSNMDTGSIPKNVLVWLRVAPTLNNFKTLIPIFWKFGCSLIIDYYFILFAQSFLLHQRTMAKINPK